MPELPHRREVCHSARAGVGDRVSFERYAKNQELAWGCGERCCVMGWAGSVPPWALSRCA